VSFKGLNHSQRERFEDGVHLLCAVNGWRRPTDADLKRLYVLRIAELEADLSRLYEYSPL
jgi:hypothetical protein